MSLFEFMFLGNYKFDLVHEDLSRKLTLFEVDSVEKSVFIEPRIGILVVKTSKSFIF